VDLISFSQEVVKIRHDAKEEIFGPGQLNRLSDNIKKYQNLSAIFISVDILHINQIRSLEQIFGCRVVDRYWLVLSIFHQHAHTLEAKMQVALAELPYIKLVMNDHIFYEFKFILFLD